MLARELADLGVSEVSPDNGQVAFSGGPEELARANLWLRTADRVWIKMGDFSASTFDELFEGTRALDWPAYLPRNAEFPVTGFSVKSQLSSVPACQKIVKKAAVEKLRAKYRMEWFPEDGAPFPIRFNLIKDHCTVLLDTSGTGLHRRGYRTYNAEAPLRETLAAGLVLLSYYNKDRLLYDPMCGSGTILLEAAMIALSRAPGLRRTFASERWPFLGEAPWKAARDQAAELFDRTSQLQLFGSDADGRVLDLARTHLTQAGLDERGIHFQKREVEDFSSKKQYAVVITNPPYGYRQGELEEVEELYRQLGRLFTNETWSLYFLTSHPDFARLFGHGQPRKRKLYNGKLACTYYQYPGPRPPGPKRPKAAAHEG